MSKIILKGYITVPKEELSIVIKELEIHKKLTLEEEGCIVFEVIQDKSIPTYFNVYEEFINKEAFDMHQVRVKNSQWGKVTKNVQRVYEVFENKES